MQGVLRPTGGQNRDVPEDRAPMTAAAGESQLTGTVKISSEMKAESQTLYLIVRPASGGPPVAVKKLMVAKFPIRFSITEADSMLPGGQSLAEAGKLRIIARLDKDGVAGPAAAGDLEGSIEAQGAGAKNLEIVLTKSY
jgi:hypothetical protein